MTALFDSLWPFAGLEVPFSGLEVPDLIAPRMPEGSLDFVLGDVDR